MTSLKITIILSAVILMAALNTPHCRAQANFSVIPVTPEEGVTQEAARMVYDKTVQILTRNSAGAAGVCDVFAVEPSLTLTDHARTSGLVRDISTVSGELTLVALNKVDGARYYSVTVPLSAVSKSSADDLSFALARSIKPTDAVFTRFVRIAREKIDDYYSSHCREVLGRARSLAAAGEAEIAMAYLTGVPASAPCHDEAVEYIAALKATVKEETAKGKEGRTPEDIVPEPSCASCATPAPEDAGDKPTQSDSAPYDIYIENPDWKFTVEKAEYIPVSRKIKITAMVEYVGRKSLAEDCALGFRQAIDSHGENYDTLHIEGPKYRRFPDGVPVRVEYIIDDVKVNPVTLGFVGLSIDYKKIEIRNLPVSK